jgi:hypothetical protein
MDTFAAHPAEERETYFQEAAAQLGLPPHVIEKDFWVCWTLRRLFALESVADNLLFKGGTSLSKAHGLIRRFSEDIDLSIHRASLGFEGETDPANPNLSNKARKKQSEALSDAARAKVTGEIQPELATAIAELLGEESWELIPDPSDPDGQSLAFAYPRTGFTQEAAAYMKPAVKIEFGARSDHWPAETKSVRPYLVDALADALENPDAEVKVMSAERTFWEKATILHQMAHLQPEKSFPPRYSRHYCDLASMIEGGAGDTAGKNDDLLAAVVEHKMLFYLSAWANYETAVRGGLRLLPGEERIDEFAKDLASMREMFFDDPPQLESVLETLREWEKQFNQPAES